MLEAAQQCDYVYQVREKRLQRQRAWLPAKPNPRPEGNWPSGLEALLSLLSTRFNKRSPERPDKYAYLHILR